MPTTHPSSSDANDDNRRLPRHNDNGRRPPAACPLQLWHGCITGPIPALHASGRRPPAPPHHETMFATVTAMLAPRPPAMVGPCCRHVISRRSTISSPSYDTCVILFTTITTSGDDTSSHPACRLCQQFEDQRGPSMRTYPLPGWTTRRIRGVHQ